MAWLQRFLQYMEDTEIAFRFLERGVDIFKGQCDLRAMIKDYMGNSPVGITPTTTTSSGTTKMNDVVDFIPTLNILNSWALFVVKNSLEKEDCRDKNFDPKGEELKADLDGAVIADLALCCVLRGISLLLGMMAEDSSHADGNSDYDVLHSNLRNQQEGAAENAAQSQDNPDEYIYKSNRNDTKNTRFGSTAEHLSEPLQVLVINDEGLHSRRGGPSLIKETNKKEHKFGQEKLFLSLR